MVSPETGSPGAPQEHESASKPEAMFPTQVVSEEIWTNMIDSVVQGTHGQITAEEAASRLHEQGYQLEEKTDTAA